MPVWSAPPGCHGPRGNLFPDAPRHGIHDRRMCRYQVPRSTTVLCRGDAASKRTGIAEPTECRQRRPLSEPLDSPGLAMRTAAFRLPLERLQPQPHPHSSYTTVGSPLRDAERLGRGHQGDRGNQAEPGCWVTGIWLAGIWGYPQSSRFAEPARRGLKPTRLQRSSRASPAGPNLSPPRRAWFV
jgi:hypothetical protein